MRSTHQQASSVVLNSATNNHIAAVEKFLNAGWSPSWGDYNAITNVVSIMSTVVMFSAINGVLKCTSC